MIALLLVLHVIAIGVILSLFRLRFSTIAGFFVYFMGFYLILGHYLKDHRQVFMPVMPLEDDYYNHYNPKRKSPFEPVEDANRETEAEEKKDEKKNLDREYKEDARRSEAL